MPSKLAISMNNIADQLQVNLPKLTDVFMYPSINVVLTKYTDLQRQTKSNSSCVETKL